MIRGRKKISTGFMVSFDSQRGATLIEYILLISLLAISSLAAISFVGNQAGDEFTVIAANLNTDSVWGLSAPSAGGGAEGVGGPGVGVGSD